MIDGLLSKSIVYLAGPIDDVPDDGMIWRKKIKMRLKENKVDIVSLDPTDKLECLSDKVGFEEKKQCNYYRHKEDWDALTDLVTGIVRIDLRQVDYCDFMILYVDPDVHMCGSYEEMALAARQRKPILAIIKGGKKRCPGWLFGRINHNLMFESVDDCADYIIQLDEGKIELDDKWVLMRKEIFDLTKESKGD